MAQQRLRHLYLLIFLLWCWPSIFYGCSATPRIYTMPPQPLEIIRADVGTVGVALVELPSESEVLMPAKGFWGGARRGFIVGARLPVLIGFVSPVPGGTLLGIFVAPFTAMFGGVYGAITAPPTMEVEVAEKTLEEASAEIKQMGLREIFLETVIGLGNDRTGHRFLRLLDIATGQPNKEILYNPSDLPGVDTVLELKIVKTGLRGSYGIDPSVNTFVQTRIRLIRLKDNTDLLDETLYCQSDQERTFQEWSQKAGIFLIAEFRSCVSELAEKTIDDFFLVYPTSSP